MAPRALSCVRLRIVAIANDALLYATLYNDDAGTPGTRTAAWPGMTLGTQNVRHNNLTTSTGFDARYDLIDYLAPTGTSSGAPTFASAWTSAIANYCGATLFIRLRIGAPGPPTVDAGADASALINVAFARTATENLNGGTAQSRAWTIEAGPAGVGNTIGTAAALSWTPTVTGQYTLRYSLTTDQGTDTDDVIVTVGFLRGEVSGVRSSDDSDLSLTLPASTAVGDLVVLIHSNDYYTLAALATPTGTAVTTWVQKTDATYDGGSNANHVKVWTGAVTTGGASTVVANWGGPDGFEERYAQALVFTSVATYDVGVSAAQSANTTWTLPSVSAASVDCYLVGTCSSATGGVTNYTFPGSMTPLTEQDGTTEATFRTGWEWRTASGSTGTRSVTSSASKAGAVTSIIIRQIGGAAPAALWPRRRGPQYRR